VKTTCVPSGERLGSLLASFVPPTTPTTEPDGTLKICTGPEQPEQSLVPLAARSPLASTENGTGPVLPRSSGFWPTETVKMPRSLPARSSVGPTQSSRSGGSPKPLEQRSLQTVLRSRWMCFPSASETQTARRML
jgi:hypothetical protein